MKKNGLIIKLVASYRELYICISDAGYSKVKPDYITNEACLANAVKVTLGL